MKIKQNIILLLLILLFSSIKAQTQKISLSQAIELSKQNSKSLKLSKTQIENTKFQIQEAKNDQLPDLKISGQTLHLFDTSTIKLNGNPSLGSAASPDQLILGQASLSLPLFSGFKIKNGIAIAQYNQQLAENSFDLKEQDVVMQTIEMYINLYKAKQAIKVVESNLERAKLNLNDYQNFEKNGIIARNDLLRVQLQESNVELALAESKKNFNVLNYNLNLLLGLPESTIIDPDLDFNYIPKGFSEGDYLGQAQKSRKEFEAFDIQNKIAEKNINIAKGNYYPSIVLSGGYMYVNVHNLGRLENATNAGIGISYNLASLFKNKSTVNVAKNQQEQIEDNLSLFNDNIKSQIHTAYENYNLNIERTHVYDKALEQANENYRIVKNKSNNGLATTDDLLTADVEQLQAALNQAYGKSDVLLSYYTLLKQTGIINQQ